MKAERIGKTPKEELRWVLSVTYKEGRRTEGDLQNLIHDACLFAGVPLLPDIERPVENLNDYVDGMVDDFRRAIERAIEHKEIDDLQPRSPKLVWNDIARRYKRVDTNENKNSLATQAYERLGELILTHGHLLKICTAPAKMKPGPKPKKTKKTLRGICGQRFLAIKETQLYHSSACLDRALVERKAKKTKKPKVKKKKRKR